MDILRQGYEGIELLVELNIDRLISLLALGGALFLASYIGALF